MIASIVALDMGVLQALYGVRDMALVQIFIYVTELGGTLTIAGLTLCTAIFLLYRWRIAELTGLIMTLAGTAVVVEAFKEIVRRARPDIFYQAYHETGFSFTSGHAAMSLAFYGFVAYLICRSTQSRAVRTATIITAAVLCALIGFSRLYLGVHFLSDVLASWVIAGIFLWVGIKVTAYVERRRLNRPSESS